MKVKGNHPLAEIIAKCMSGVETVPKQVIRRMVSRACREAVKYHEAALQSHNSQNIQTCGSCKFDGECKNKNRLSLYCDYYVKQV